jgi:hypothetical protein
MKDGRLVFTKYKPLNIFIAILIQYVWSKLEDLTFLIVNSMISILIPGIPGKINSTIINLIYFDIFYPELWLSDFMQYFFKLDLEDALVNDYPISM